MTRFTSILRAALIATFVIGLSEMPSPARAGGAEPADIDGGRVLAETRCANCHAVGRTGKSPISAAPPFRVLGRKWPVENLAEALAEGIVVGHPAMPAFAFSPAEIDDFLGWLGAIQER